MRSKECGRLLQEKKEQEAAKAQAQADAQVPFHSRPFIITLSLPPSHYRPFIVVLLLSLFLFALSSAPIGFHKANMAWINHHVLSIGKTTVALHKCLP